MHSAMAVSASSSICGVNFALLVPGVVPPGLWTSSVKCVAIVGKERFGSARSGVPLISGRRRASQMVLALAADEVNSTDPKGKSTKTEENTPAWAQPGTDELPPWAKNERPQTHEPAQDFPFFVYLIGSCLVSIAAVGSIFEYFYRNPVFGVVQPDSPLWAPLLGFFIFAGLPTAGFLFSKGVKVANKASEEIDREDGFLGR